MNDFQEGDFVKYASSIFKFKEYINSSACTIVEVGSYFEYNVSTTLLKRASPLEIRKFLLANMFKNYV